MNSFPSTSKSKEWEITSKSNAITKFVINTSKYLKWINICIILISAIKKKANVLWVAIKHSNQRRKGKSIKRNVSIILKNVNCAMRISSSKCKADITVFLILRKNFNINRKNYFLILNKLLIKIWEINVCLFINLKWRCKLKINWFSFFHLEF